MKSIIITLMLVFLLVAPTVSASFEFDNWRTFDKGELKYGKITIDNAFGFGEKLAEYTLEENTDQCLYNCYAEGTATLFYDDKLFTNLKFKDKSGKEKNLRDSQIYILEPEFYEIPNTRYVCEDIVGSKNNSKNCFTIYDGTQELERMVWKEYNGKVLPTGIYKWRIEATKGRYESIDWIVTSLGQELTEWAWWNPSFLNRRIITNINGSLPLPINNSNGTDIDGNGTVEWIYGAVEPNPAGYVYYNANEVPRIANDTEEGLMVQTFPIISTQGNIPDGLGTWLPLDDLQDDTLNATDVIYTSDATVEASVVKAVTGGVMHNGYDFPGGAGANFIKFVGNNPINTLHEGSICIWARPDNADTVANIWMEDSSGSGVFTLGTDNGEIFRWRVGGDIVIDLGATHAFDAGELFHLCLTWDDDPDDYTIYKNSTSIANSAASATMDPAISLIIGGRAAETSGYDGKFYDIQFYNKTLSQNEVTVLYNLGTSVGEPLTLSLDLAITFPTNTSYNILTQNINYTTNADDSCWYSLNDGVDNSTRQDPAVNWTAITMNEGKNNLIVYCNDSTIQPNLDDVNFTIDSLFPLVNITFPENETLTDDIASSTNKTFFFNWTASDTNLGDIGNCRYNFDDSDNVTVNCADINASLNLLYGSHRLRLFANDTIGNTNVSIVDFTLDFNLRENTQTFNTDSFETVSENFNINITTEGTAPTNVLFYYNGTQHSGNVASIGSNDYNLSATIDIPLNTDVSTFNASRSWKFSFDIGATNVNTSSYIQVVNKSIFALCNGTTPDRYINFTFINETIAQEPTSATINSEWTYYLGSGTVNKTLSFANSTGNVSYSFCLSPSDRPMNTVATIAYANSEAAQRVHRLNNALLTNATTNTVLYLLPTILGIFTRYQTITANGDVINSVSAIVSRTLGGSTIQIGSSLTDDSGLVIFFLNPDVLYDYLFSKAGFNDNIFTLNPNSPDTYTVIMASSVPTANQTVVLQNTLIEILPSSSTLPNQTDVTFILNVTSNEPIIYTSINITNSSGSQFLFVTGSAPGIISGTINTVKNQSFVGYFTTGTETENSTITKVWFIGTTFEGDYSINKQMRLFMTYDFSIFIRMLLIVSIIIIVLIYLSVNDLGGDDELKIMVALLMVWVFSIVGWLNTGLSITTGVTSADLLTSLGNQYGIAIMVSAIGAWALGRRILILRG